MYYDLGQRKRGETIEVSLSAAANVFLVDNANYSSFKSGRDFRYFGGLAKQTPVPLTVPSDGHWWVVIHLWGLKVPNVRHSIRVLPSAMPEMRISRQPSLQSIIRDVADAEPEASESGSEEFDLFISHATEDKEGIVRGLVSALRERGVDVWYDEFELRIGDSLRRKIDQGLARSRFVSSSSRTRSSQRTGRNTSSTAWSRSRWLVVSASCRSGTKSRRTRSSATAPRSQTRSR